MTAKNSLAIRTILKSHWGYDAFRPMQEDIINTALQNKDCLALLPTGGGKSLCYQVPAMAKDGLCLVISPLIALMKDQVENLRKKGITAFSIFSGMKHSEVLNVLKVAGESNCKFLYVSPERLETNLFKEYLPSLNINLVAIDEAHCVSQWGYDFRPPYLRIAALREEIPGVPFLALTASATPDVQSDICDKLGLEEPAIFRQSFSRPNLSYSVFHVDAKINKLLEILNNVPGSSIVYCRNRKRTKDIATQLAAQNISADFYHAGLSNDERSKKQEAWIQNKIRTIVCTNAFGMGIDKPDVRVVVHMDIPDCLENYYQEAGRAGRDGKKSYAVLLYQEADLKDPEEEANIRYPSVEVLRKVYQSVCNYLQLPVDSPEYVYHDFDMNAFIKTFNLPPAETMNALKQLEQEGYMSFSEQVFLPAKLMFTCNKETLDRFEEEHENLEPIIKILLRSYEGIYDRETAIYEKSVAFWLKKELNEVQQSLTTLHRYGIVKYEPQKDTPRLCLLQPRVVVERVAIQQTNYLQRKKLFIERMKAMLAYTKSIKDCRSTIIGKYFGDDNIIDCGICDNCLQRKKKAPLSAEEFSRIHQQVKTHLASSPLSSNELLKKLTTVKKEKAWQVLEFMQAENEIVLTKDGMISLKK